MNNLFRELQRRNVIRVAAAYLVVGWIVMQVVDVIGNAAGMPDWADSFALIILVVGLPVVLFIAWAFELTPEGMKKTAAVSAAESRTEKTGQVLNYAILGAIIVLVGIMVWRQLVPAGDYSPAETLVAVEDGEINAPEEVEENVPVERSLAVLPFASFSVVEANQYFADGLTEEILNSLAAIPDLLVTSRTSSFQFRGTELPSLPEIGVQLGVAHVLEGSVRRSGNQVRVTAQLIRVADDSHLWSQTYDRSMDDVFAIQEDIAENVASALEVVLDSAQLERMRNTGARNVEAFVAYQRGLSIWRELHDIDEETRLDEANVYFAEATRLDPRFSEAYLFQSDYFSHLMVANATNFQAPFDREAYDTARAEQVRLLELAERVSDSALRAAIAEANALLFSEDWTRAQALLNILARSTECAADNWVNTLAEFAESSAELLEFYRRQTRCDPLNPTIWGVFEGAALRMGAYEEAMWAHRRHNELGVRRSEAGEENFLEFEVMFAEGRYEELEAALEQPGVDAFGRQFFALRLAAMRGDRETTEGIRRFFLQVDGIPPEGEIVMAALVGDRTTANETAARVDERPLSFIVLSRAINFCGCGAPFDLDSTPNFASRLDEAGFPWPPRYIADYPMKDW